MRNEQDIEKFVNDLLTEPAYFPKLGRAVTDFNADTDPVKEAAQLRWLGRSCSLSSVSWG